VSAVAESAVEVNGQPCRVWEKGTGEPLGYLGGLCGVPRWTPFLERLAQHRRIIVPSLPGFPGGLGHDRLDTPLDWIAATLDLLQGAGLERADLIGASVGGTLAAEVAALSGVKRLVLIAPFGLYEEGEPVVDPWAVPPGDQHLLSARPEKLAELLAKPDDADQVEWQVTLTRAGESAARLLWPTTDTGLIKRLHRITAPTLVVWGSADQVIPASYAKRLAAAVRGPTTVRSIEGAGHLADVDAPEAVADAVVEFLR
jgi:pimeloyl-ACP methyl ester carboxylesterase